MTISTTTNRASFAGNGSTTAFATGYKFFADGDLTVILVVDSTGVETTKTITTHYTVAGAGAASGGTVTMVTAPASGETLVIVREQAYTQGTDLVENDPFPSQTVEDQLDKITIMAQQNNDAATRSASFPEGYTGAADPNLPSPTANYVLGWDSTALALENKDPSDLTGLTIYYLGAFATTPTTRNDGSALAEGDLYWDSAGNAFYVYSGSSFERVGLSSRSVYVFTASGGETSLTGTDDNGLTLSYTAGLSRVEVYKDTGSGGVLLQNGSDYAATTSTSITGLTALSASDVVTIVDTTAVSDAELTSIGVVGGIAANVTTVAGISANVTTVAGISANVTTVAGVSADVTSVAGISADVTAVAAVDTDVATLANVEDGTVSTNAISNLGPISTDITAVSGVAANVTTVAGISANVTTVAGIAADVTTTAGISADVTTVAADGTDIGTVAGISADVTSVAGVASNVTTVAGVAGNVTTVAGIAANVTTVAGVSADVTTVAGISGDVSAVAAQVIGYDFSTTTTMADPGAGNVRFNNVTLASVSQIAIDDLDKNGVDQSAFIILWDDSTNTVKGTLVFRTAGGDVATFLITGLTDNAGWSQVAVTHVASSGTFGNGEDTFIGFTRAGDKGADGEGAGDVIGPASATDNTVARYNSTTGKLIQGSGVTIDDSNLLTVPGGLAVNKGGDIASASPLVIDTDGGYFDVTGTTGFSAITVAANRLFTLQWDGIVTVTHGAALVLPGGANLTTAAGDVWTCYSTAANTVVVTNVATASPSGGGGLYRGNNGTTGTSSGDIFRINATTLTLDEAIESGENASAAGPLSIASGITLTINGALVIL